MKAKFDRMQLIMSLAKKRQEEAKAIGREMLLKEALNKEAQICGFKDIDDMNRELWANESVCTYNPYNVDWRLKPNAKLDLSDHKWIGGCIDEVYVASKEHRYSVFEHVGFVQDELGRWFEEEYPEKIIEGDYIVDPYNSLGSNHDYDYDPEFHSDPETLSYITAEKKQYFCSELRSVKAITARLYPICKPVQTLHKHVEKAIKAIEKWHTWSEQKKSKKRRPQSWERFRPGSDSEE